MNSSKIERRIKKIKQQLQGIGEMRPGSLSKQYNVCGVKGCQCKDPVNPKRHGPYYQLSFSHKGKSTTRFVRRHQLKQTRAQTISYKKFRKLVDLWADLALKQADEKMKAMRDTPPQ